MLKNNEWIEVAKYVTGNCSIEKKKTVENKMLSDEDFKNIVNEVRKAWELSVSRTGKWDTNKAWNNVLQKLNAPENVRSINGSYTLNKKKNRNTGFSINYIARIAAILLISAITGILFYQFSEHTAGEQVQNQQQLKEFIARKGEHKKFHLSDGTEITLAPESKIRLSSEYISGSREVFLEGEAFFDVTVDPDHPFRVYVNETTTEVLGTQFNIVSYPDDEKVQVVVVEGSVELRAERTNRQILLKPGELGSYTSSDQILTTKKVDVNAYIGWMSGKLIFENQPLSKVVTRLERWYDLTFNVEGANIRERKLTATFSQRQPLEEVLDAIAMSLDLTYVKHDGSFTFKQ
jgi:ferric-dicitrate binding protein FerR (iron transport regulator)